MNSTQGSVARQSRDDGETSHETPVIPLRPALAEPPQPQAPEPVDVARRRAEALRLSRDENLSLREIGKRLGIGKDAVSRDIKAALREEAQAAEEASCDADTASHETADSADETPAAPEDGDHDTLVLVLDEPLRQALAVLRASRRRPDTPAENVAVVRAAVRLMADTMLAAQQLQEGPTL